MQTTQNLDNAPAPAPALSLPPGEIEFLQGQESHTSYWGKFYVKGLEEFECKEDDPRNRRDSHHRYTFNVCLSVPDTTLFSVFIQDGSKRGTDLYEFYICEVDSTEPTQEISHNYTGCDIKGRFKIIAQATTKTKAPRLLEWWNSHPKTKETALLCAKYIDKRGQKTLPED
jgi:hypothetical protein